MNAHVIGIDVGTTGAGSDARGTAKRRGERLGRPRRLRQRRSVKRRDARSRRESNQVARVL